MNTPADLMRQHYPKFLKDLNTFKEVFGKIKREHIKCDLAEFGKPLTGVAVNPVISDKIKSK